MSTAAPTTTTVPPPVPADFIVGVIITEQKCFGSAGCSYHYTISPQYISAKPLPDETTVVLTVSGGEQDQVGNSPSIRTERRPSTGRRRSPGPRVPTFERWSPRSFPAAENGLGLAGWAEYHAGVERPAMPGPLGLVRISPDDKDLQCEHCC